MAIRRVAGTANVYADGRNLALRGNLSVNDQESVREGIAGQDSVHGWKETPKVPSVSMDITTMRDLDMDWLRAVEEATVTCELASGHTYTLRQAWFAQEGAVDTAEGQISITFEGMSGDWH